MNKSFNREEIEELVEQEDTLLISEEYQQHDITLLTYVVKIEDSYWKFSFERSDDNGWQIYGSVDAAQVKPREKIVIEWVKV